MLSPCFSLRYDRPGRGKTLPGLWKSPGAWPSPPIGRIGFSEPKRPVRPSSGPDGADGVPERTPGTDGYLGVRPEDCRDGRAGTAGVSGCGICRAPPCDGWALKVTGQEVPRGNWRRQQVTADDRGVR